jgi:hypothetical protein
MMECIVTIRSFSGATRERKLAHHYDLVRCMIGSARPETAAFYENVPLGQLYEFVIRDSRISSIPDGSEITVTDPQASGFEVDDVFIVTAKSQKQRMAGRFLIAGSCYQKP